MVIIPLLAIELKATCNGNLIDDFYWRQKNLTLLMLCNVTPPVDLLFFTAKSC